MDTERWKRLSPLLDALLDMEPASRAEHLQTLREQDPILAGELQHLLSLDSDAPDFLDTPIVNVPTITAPGARIGAYQLKRLLGEGGMGQVWLAARADGLYERDVALKLLRPGLLDPQLRQRFDREREILARFAHPNIAHLLDAGISASGQPYLALEYVEGRPLTDWCQERQFDLPTRIDLFRQVCDAVSHAHANLIVHRDLKPSNILVTRAGQVQLLDFGIAKLLDVKPLPIERTRTGVRAFTLHYAAPEQVRGEPVTTMTDVYSLGVVLYELLTGSKPYRLTRQTDAEWEEAILVGEPQKPSQAAARATPEQAAPYSPARLARVLAGDLDNILLKALAKQPEQRYPSVEALSQDLLNHLRGLPVQARGESLGYRLRKYLYRHRWVIAASSAIVLVLMSALGIVSWQAQRAMREAARAQAMQRYITELFKDAGSASGTPIDLRDLLSIGIQRGERSLARQPQARAELYGVVAQLRLGLGDYREANELLNRQAVLLAQLPDAPTSLRLEAATLRGDAMLQLGEPQPCVARMQPMDPLARRDEQRLPVQVSAFYSQLGRCQRTLGKTEAAKRLFNRAMELRRHENDNAGMAESTLDLATLQSDTGKPIEAIATLSAGLNRLYATLGERHPLAIDMLRTRCSLERATDALDAAINDCRTSLQLARELHGPNHRTTIDANRELAALYVDRGRFNEAEAILQDTLTWMRARLDHNHPDLARTYNSLAMVAWERGETEQALRYERQAASAWRKSGNETLVAGGVYNLATILHGIGRNREALPLAREAVKLRTHQYGAGHELVGDSERLQGEILAALGNTAAARTALESAVKLTLHGFGAQHSHTRLAQIALARLLAQQGDRAALADLIGYGAQHSHDLEQRKAAWLARAYAADLQCRITPKASQPVLDAIVSEMQDALPEGGAMPREVEHIRKTCH